MTTTYTRQRGQKKFFKKNAKSKLGEDTFNTDASSITTRSNTPEANLIENKRQESSQDLDFSILQLNATNRILSTSSQASTNQDLVDSQTFEIDVQPKRKVFTNYEERMLFIQGYKQKFKTEMCKNWELRGQCKFGNKCCFAHGKHELKAKSLTHVKYKTKPCKQYHQTGYCSYGLRCQYQHKDALYPNIFYNPKAPANTEHHCTYDMLSEINKLCTSETSTLEEVYAELPQRSRLSVFTSLTDEQ